MKPAGELAKEVVVGLGALIQLLLLFIWQLVLLPFKVVFLILKLLFKGAGDDLKSWRPRINQQ